MKHGIKAVFFCACLALVCSGVARAEELKPLEEIPLPAHEPVAQKLSQQLAEPLLFSASQTKRVERALAAEVDNKAERLVRQYAALSDELRTKRYELRELIYSLYMLRSNLPEAARDGLSPQKKEIFDPYIYDGRFQYDNPRLAVVPKAQEGDEVVETTTTLPNGQVVKKKIIIRRKKKEEAKPGVPDAVDSPAAELQFESLLYTPQP